LGARGCRHEEGEGGEGERVVLFECESRIVRAQRKPEGGKFVEKLNFYLLSRSTKMPTKIFIFGITNEKFVFYQLTGVASIAHFI
jgi:hypothetical protein